MDTFYLRTVLLNILRSDTQLVVYTDQDGFVKETVAMSALKYHTGFTDMTDAVFKQILDDCGRYVERNEGMVRASYGHKGHMLARINWGKYVPYQGRYSIFCISHIVRNGLGAVNYNRRFNILNTPERCENKGVKGFIDIHEARKKGMEFWSQVGDRYGNKIFCFDTNLSDIFFRYEYVHDYTSPERILKFQAHSIDLIKRVCGLDQEGAIKHMQKLMIQEDDEGVDELDLESLRI